MSKALGLIETRGLIAGIEAADAMVKAANVTIIGKEITNPALVTIKITGDVAAVKAAVDAGEAAARKVGEVVSIHIIPQPDDQIIAILPEINSQDYTNNLSEPNIVEDVLPESSEIAEEIIPETQSETDDPLPSSETETNVSKDVVIVKKLKVQRPVEKIIKKEKEVLPEDVKKIIKKEKEILPKDEIPMQDFAGTLFETNNDTISRLRKEALLSEEVEKPLPEKMISEYENMNVHQLRHLARGMDNLPIKGREISKANRQDLIKLLKGV